MSSYVPLAQQERHSQDSMDIDLRSPLKPGTPIGALPKQHDSGFDEPSDLDLQDQEEVINSDSLIIPRDGSYSGGEAEQDRVMTSDYTLPDSGVGLSLGQPINKQLDTMKGTTIVEPHAQEKSLTVTKPRKARNRVTKIADSIPSRINSSNTNTVQAPSNRTQSPSLVSSSYNYPSSLSSQSNESYMTHSYSAPVMHQSSRPTIFNNRPSQWPSIDLRAMLQQNLQFFLPDKEGDTGLHLAVIHSQSDLLDRLLYLMSKEPSLQSVIDEQNSLYQTPLHLAVHTQQTDMIRKLLLSGASLNLPDHKGNTALHIAAQFSSTKSLEELALYVPMQTLLEGAHIRNNNGQTCVHVAAHHGNADVLRKLKSLGVDVDMQDLKSGKTALHLSVENGSLRDVQFLLETCHANVNATTFTSCTPLHIASGRGDISTAAYLLSQGADPDLQTDEGDTALELAGSEEVMSLLTKAAALKWMY